MTNLTQIFPEKKERTDFWIAITVIVIFLTAILYYIFGSEKKEVISNVAVAEQSAEKKDEFDYKTKTPITYQSYDAKTEREEALDTLVASVRKDVLPFQKEEVTDEGNGTTTAVLEKTTVPVPEIEKPVYVEEEEVASIGEELQTEIKDSLETNIIKEEAIEKVIPKPEPETKVERSNRGFELTSSEQDQIYGCIIIIGSFKEPKNAKALAQKLGKQNYPVYEGIYKGYYIVGVNADCKESEILPLLKKMRVEYEKSAWVYKR